MSGRARPTRAAHREPARVSAGEDDDSDASKLEDGPAPMPPRKRARSGKGRPEVRRQSRVRGGSSQLSPAEKMQKMRQWFEQNDGTPRFDDSTAGFNMGKFWQTCCSRGYHKELFTAALAESSKMKEAHEARLKKKNMNTLLRGLRHRQASSDESDSDDDVLLSALRRPKGDEGEGKLPPPPAEKMEQDWSSR